MRGCVCVCVCVEKLGKTTTNLLTKARSLVSGEDALPVTRVVQTVCDGRSTSDADGIVTLDPKLPPGSYENAAILARSFAGVQRCYAQVSHRLAQMSPSVKQLCL
jgi:hypothetical protein